MRPRWRKRIAWALGLLVLLAAGVAFFAWYKFFREEPQVGLNTAELQFKYGSFGAENDAGIPYWVWVVLPRIFPDLLPGPGGYKSFGFPWEEGAEVPVGFAKKTVGFPRVTNNCAVCHTSSYRTRPDENPTIVVPGSSHTSYLQEYIRFISKAANDPRFNPDTILAEINQATKLSTIDKLLYRFIIIPFTRKALLERDPQFAWMNRPGRPDWGVGRTDPMNLTKYFMAKLKEDDTVGQSDAPAIWNLQNRQNGHSLNWDGATPAVRSVVIDSALGLQAPPSAAFLKRMGELEAWLNTVQPPKFADHFPVDQALVSEGSRVFAQNCARCHALDGELCGKVIPIDEIGTDDERLKSWTKEGADAANRIVKEMGIDRPGLVKTDGYVAGPLDGIWLRAPYLHNGSVPTLRDLLEPVQKRSPGFFRGYDVIDPVDVGFVTQGAEPERIGFCLDTEVRGESNRGHLYGTELPAAEKTALIEFLKTQ